MVKLTAEDVNKMACAAKTVKNLDACIEWLGRDIEANLESHGRAIRDIYGRNRLPHFTDAVLGEIVFCAIVNALLKERDWIVNEYGHLVEFPEPPCPEQKPREDS